jgi:hypothetical protein
MVIRRVGVGSAARIFAALYALFGLIFGVFVALLAVAGAGMSAATEDAIPGWAGGLFGVGAVIFLPLLYGAMGAIGGALTAGFYNIAAGMVGGLQIETDEERVPVSLP